MGRDRRTEMKRLAALVACAAGLLLGSCNVVPERTLTTWLAVEPIG